MPGMEGIKMLSAMGPSAVTAIRMPSDGRRTSGAPAPPGEESEGLCAGALMGTAGMWTAGWRIWAVARKNAAEAYGRRSAMQPAIWGRRLRLSTAMAWKAFAFAQRWAKIGRANV